MAEPGLQEGGALTRCRGGPPPGLAALQRVGTSLRRLLPGAAGSRSDAAPALLGLSLEEGGVEPCWGGRVSGPGGSTLWPGQQPRTWWGGERCACRDSELRSARWRCSRQVSALVSAASGSALPLPESGIPPLAFGLLSTAAGPLAIENLAAPAVGRPRCFLSPFNLDSPPSSCLFPPNPNLGT